MFASHRFVKAAVVLAVAVLCAVVASTVNPVTAVSGDDVSYSVPILMYHSVCKNSRVHSDYLIEPERFEEDIRYLKSHGYTAVFVQDIVRFVRGEGDLPEKSILITLDDGFYNNLSNVLPVLKRYGFKATVSVVGSYCEQFTESGDKNPAYAYLSWDDIAELDASGVVEIGSHTYKLHSLGSRRGCKIKKGESAEQYRELLKNDLAMLQNALKEKSGVEAKVFAYPYGEVCDESRAVLTELGFDAGLNCREKINVINSKTDLFSLCRINRQGHLTTEDFMQKWGIE